MAKETQADTSLSAKTIPSTIGGSNSPTTTNILITPAKNTAAPNIQGATQEDYEAAIRAQLLPREDFWRKHANHEAYRSFIKDKTEAERALIADAFQIDLDTENPTLDACIPRHSILEVVDRYFWEHTDIPRELPFFYVLHFVMALLLQKGVQIHKGKQVILPDLWTVVLATSGAGKSLSQKQLNKAMDTKINLFSEAKTSLQFLTNLRDERLSLYLRDEFAQFLKSVSKEPNMQNVRDYLLRTYDNGDIDHTTTKSSVEVKNSAISILGYTPTKTLKLHLTKEMLLDGFAQRFSYCVSEKDDRPVIGDYDFDTLSDHVAPLWKKLADLPVHPVYTVTKESRGVFSNLARQIIGNARELDIEDSFSRRLAFTTYKYGLAYHFLAGKTSSEIDGEDLAQAAQLVALHLRDLRKVLDFYESDGGKPRASKSDQLFSPIARIAVVGGIPTGPTSESEPALKEKISIYLNARKTSNATPLTIGKIQSGLRAARRSSADEVRISVKQVIAEDPTLALFVKF